MKKILKLNIINILFIIYFMCSSYFSPIKWILYVGGLISYTIYLFKKNELEIVKYIISYTIITTVIIDYLFVYLHINVPFELKYIPEILSLLLVYIIVMKLDIYKEILNDSLFIIAIMIILFNFIYLISNDSNIYEYINGLRMYARYLPIYVILKVNDIDLSEEFKLYYFINIILMLLQVMVNTGKDNINGIFGLSGTTSSGIFMMTLLGIMTIKYIQKDINILKYIACIVITSITFVIQENKAFIIMQVLYIIFILLLCKGNMLKKMLGNIIIVVAIILSVHLLLELFPGYKSFVSKDTFKSEISNYLLKNNNDAFRMGRLQTLSYLDKLEMNKGLEELLGNGLGYSLPKENWYYEGIAKTFWSNNSVYDLNASRFYSRYGSNFGYHLSSLVILYLELGWSGILMITISLIIIMKRSINLILHKLSKTEDQIWGTIGINICMSSLFGFIYGSELQNRIYIIMIAILLGIMSHKESKLKIENRGVRVINEN